MLIVWAGLLSTHQNLPTTEYKNEHSRKDWRPSTRAALKHKQANAGACVVQGESYDHARNRPTC